MMENGLIWPMQIQEEVKNTFHYLSWEHSIFIGSHSIFIGSKLSSKINVVDLI